MRMSDYPLWKRLRVLANPLRLEMLSLLARQPRQFVRVVGEQLRCSEDIASKHLQNMADGGFLTSEREGRFLFYSVRKDDLLTSLTVEEIRRAGSDIGSVMKLLTAFTHERRIEIVRQLALQEMDAPMLGAKTGISSEALGRHLRKLSNRGFVCRKDDRWRLRRVPGRYAQGLLKLAVG